MSIENAISLGRDKAKTSVRAMLFELVSKTSKSAVFAGLVSVLNEVRTAHNKSRHHHIHKGNGNNESDKHAHAF